MSESRKASWLVLLGAAVAAVALLFGGVRVFKSQQDARRFFEFHKAVKHGRISEDEAQQDLGEDYPAYRKFVDSLPD